MRLTVEQNIDDAPVHGSEALLTHLVGNLVENAIQHNYPGGSIHLAAVTNADAGTARLGIENSGPLLDQSQLPELTQPFRRMALDRTSHNDGAGLGLSIVAAIVTTHDGTLDLHARPDGGLRVTITLPPAGRPAPTARART